MSSRRNQNKKKIDDKKEIAKKIAYKQQKEFNALPRVETINTTLKLIKLKIYQQLLLLQ